MSSFHFTLTIATLPTLATPPFVRFPFLAVPSTLELFLGAESVSTHSNNSRITWPKPHTQHCHWFYWLKQHNTVVNPFPLLISHFGLVNAKLCRCRLKLWLRFLDAQGQFLKRWGSIVNFHQTVQYRIQIYNLNGCFPSHTGSGGSKVKNFDWKVVH